MDSKEINRAARRDRKADRRKNGMRVSGRRLGEITRNVIIKAQKEAR